MSRERPTSRAEQDLVRACHSGLAGEELRRAVLAGLRRLMPIDAAFYATADPETLLFTGGWPEEPLAAATGLFLENEFGQADVNKFAALADAAAHVSSLDAATRAQRGTSPRYREIMHPLGLGDELRAALVADGQCWGYLCLHRAESPLGFTADEAAALARVAPHIAEAVRQSLLLHGPARGDDLRPGIVLLGEDLGVVAMTPEAEHLLSELERPRGGLPLPMAVYAVATAFAAVEAGTVPAGVLPGTRVVTADGRWLSLSASRLAGAPGSEHITVIVEPLQPRAAVPLVLSAYGLSDREAEVARLVLRGQPTRAIAGALHISEHTVQDHLKAVFGKTGVRSRRDLVARLLGAAP